MPAPLGHSHRMLRGKLGHPNLLRITDIWYAPLSLRRHMLRLATRALQLSPPPGRRSQMDNKLCMVMPKFGCNLLDAIKGA